jgi:hypothetical protein
MSTIPKMERQVELDEREEELEFSVLWFVTLHDPSFEDAG